MASHVEIQRLSVARDRFSLSITDLAISQDSHLVLVGGNGAGKSTLIEALLGLTATAALEIMVAGAPARQLDKRAYGAQLQSLAWNPEFWVGDIIDLHTALYGRGSRAVYERLGIGDLASKGIGKTSRGERVRVDLYMAFAHEPDLIFLDEPTAGLDAGYMSALFALMDEARAHGATLVSATHDPAEVERADLVWWIEAGRLKNAAPLDVLIRRELGPWKAELTPGSPDIASDLKALLGGEGLELRPAGRDAFIIYGDARLGERITDISQTYELRGWGVSQTDAADFLQHVAVSAPARTEQGD